MTDDLHIFIAKIDPKAGVFMQIYQCCRRWRIMIFLGLLFTFVWQADAFAMPQQQKIRVAFFALDGFNDVDKDGYYSGYGYEYLMEISKYTNWHYEFVTTVEMPDGQKHPLTLPMALEMVAAGKLDMIGSLVRTPEREQILAFPDYPSGMQYRMLTVAHTNHRYHYGRFDTFAGMRIGLVCGSESNKELDPFCAKNNFTDYTKIFFATYDELKNALRDGQIDSAFTSNLRKGSDEKAIAVLELYAQYFATSPNNTAVLEGLNYALSKITVQKPKFNAQLYTKYYDDDSIRIFELMEDEVLYLKDRAPIVVKVDPKNPPFAYLDQQGNLCGVIVDIGDYIERQTGLRVEYIQALDARIFTGGIKFLRPADSVWNQKNDERVTSPYLSDTISVITNKEAVGRRVAYVRNTLLDTGYAAKQGYSDFIAYNSANDCIMAVDQGKADLTFVSTNVAECAKNENLLLHSVSNIVQDTEVNYGVSVPNEEDGKLFLLLNRVIESIPQSYLYERLKKHVEYGREHMTLKTWLYQNPITGIVIVSIFLLMLMLCVGTLQRRQNLILRAHNQKMKEIISQRNAMRLLSETDGLTGLSNKEHFQKAAKKKLQEVHGALYMLMFLDFDNFKVLNDRFGHLEGDEVLKKAGAILRQYCHEADLVGRFGGDEFYIFAQVNSPEKAHKRGTAICRAISDLEIGDGNNDFILSVSIGVATTRASDQDFAALLEKADKALYRAKGAGKGRVALYEEN